MISGHSEKERDENFTPYRVVADHVRAASFLIADGVVPGNVGRNYVCRMIIRRGARFGSKLGLVEPFFGKIAKIVIDQYGDAFPELKKNRKTIIDNLTREEERFAATVEGGLAFLDDAIKEMKENGEKILDGNFAFSLYATHGLPLEITRDVLREKDLNVDQDVFFEAMEEHRINSGAGKEFGPLGGEDSGFYLNISNKLKAENRLGVNGVEYDPYDSSITDTEIAGIITGKECLGQIKTGEEANIILAKTGFYIASGGQVSDIGEITTQDGQNIFEVRDVRKPSPGIIVHNGIMVKGKLNIHDKVTAKVNQERRKDIKRNHTATHLLQSQLRKVLGDHVRQAGSLVAADRLRFDFTHPSALTLEDIRKIETGVNNEILNNYPLLIEQKNLTDALEEGATALFGEKYGDVVRTITIGSNNPVSYELCGGTHVDDTAEIGHFIIISEGSAAAGIRRIEAVTGRKSYDLINKRLNQLSKIRQILNSSSDEVVETAEKLVSENTHLRKMIEEFDSMSAKNEYQKAKSAAKRIGDKFVVTLILQNSNSDTMREIADTFRKDFPLGIAVIGNKNDDGNIQLIATVTDGLLEKGADAGKTIKKIAEEIGGSGGGRPQLAQGGGTNLQKLMEIFENIEKYI